MKVTDEVYREYSQMVYKYLFSLTGDAHVAEEVTQETFYQAVRCAGRFDGSCRFSTWLCAIAENNLFHPPTFLPPSDKSDDNKPLQKKLSESLPPASDSTDASV